MHRTWGDELDGTREVAFVGRATEIARFESFLDGPAHVLHVHGQGGIGKTTLLQALLRRARDRGLRVAFADARDVARGSPAVFAEGMALLIEGADLIAIDTFGHMAAMEDWFRERWLTQLPASTRVLLAGREHLSLRWYECPAWRSRIETMELGLLSEADSIQYLLRHGIARESAPVYYRFTHGHPLALDLLVETMPELRRAHRLAPDGDRAIASMVRRLTIEDATPPQRRALEACALVRELHPALFQAMGVPDSAYQMIEWLRTRPFVETTERGLRLHGLIRESLSDELRFRFHQNRERMLDGACAYYLGALRESGTSEAYTIVRDLFFALRTGPGARGLGFEDEGDYEVEVLGAGEHERVLVAVEAHEGPSGRELAAWWLARQPRGALAFRDAQGGLAAFALFIDLDSADEEARERDPAVHAFFLDLSATAPLRPGEGARMCRFWMSLEDHQELTPVRPAILACQAQRLAFAADTSVGSAVYAWPERWVSRPDITHEVHGRFELDGLPYVLLTHDFRVESPMEWIGRYVRAARSAVPLDGRTAPPKPVTIMDRESFEAAVRKALRWFHSNERLMGSPLNRSRVMVQKGTEEASQPMPVLLRDWIRGACASLDPSDQAHLRILTETYFGAPKKQLAVADDLGLSFGTYRRHLAQAVSWLTERLWQEELSTGR